jgi:hypothetical protein
MAKTAPAPRGGTRHSGHHRRSPSGDHAHRHGPCGPPLIATAHRDQGARSRHNGDGTSAHLLCHKTGRYLGTCRAGSYQSTHSHEGSGGATVQRQRGVPTRVAMVAPRPLIAWGPGQWQSPRTANRAPREGRLSAPGWRSKAAATHRLTCYPAACRAVSGVPAAARAGRKPTTKCHQRP